jgi:hypothetical protein
MCVYMHGTACMCMYTCVIIIGVHISTQVKVRDIHVRYEDGVTNPDTLLAAGITLHSLELKVRT